MTTDRVFELAAELRRDYDIPMVFMTYANPVYHYGAETFFEKAAAAGVDGIIIPDCPFEERDEFAETAERHGIDLISMIAPTSEDRIKTIASDAKGFIYVVSSLGVTGVRNEITTDLSSILALIKEATDTPAAIGFGISKPEQAERMSKLADGVIVGSAMVRIVAEHGKDAPKHLAEYVKSMKAAI